MRLKMMTGGGSLDIDSLTAGKSHVLEGLSFFGTGSDEEQIGEMPDKSIMRDSPGFSEKEPAVPIYHAVPIITKDTTGQGRIALCPDWGCYPGSEKAFVGCTPEELGISGGIIANGSEIAGVAGSYGSDSDFSPEDLREGKVAYGRNGRIGGTAKDYGAVVKTLAAGESYQIAKGVYSAGKITAKDLASQTGGDAAAENILTNKTAWVNGRNISGKMPNRGNIQTAKNAYFYSHTDGQTYLVNWMPGGFYDGWQTGKGDPCAEVWTNKKTLDGLIGKATISAASVRGFTSGYSGSEEESFTMPRDGTVYYGGMTAAYGGSRNVVCEIYKNGTVVDGRNINPSNDYAYRGTMFNRSFAAKKGDVIKVKADSISGTHAISSIQAVIVY